MIVPALGTFAPGPNLAEAYLGGQRLSLASQQLAQSAQEHADTVGLARERAAQQQGQFEEGQQLEQQKLQQAYALNEMHMAAQQQVREQQNLMAQQKLEVQKAYNASLIGLRQQQLQVAAAGAAVKMAQFSAKQAAQEQLSTAVQSNNPEDWRRAALMYGPAAGIPSGAYSAVMKNPNEAAGDFGALHPLMDESGGDTGYSWAATGTGSRRILETPNMNPAPAPPGYERYGKRLLPQRETLEAKKAEQALKEWDAAHKPYLHYITGGDIPTSVTRSNKVAALKVERDAIKAAIPSSVTKKKSRFIVEEFKPPEE